MPWSLCSSAREATTATEEPRLTTPRETPLAQPRPSAAKSDCIDKAPASKCSHILRGWGKGSNPWILTGHKIQPRHCPILWNPVKKPKFMKHWNKAVLRWLLTIKVIKNMNKWSESHSVVSNSLRPSELYSSWNSPGQNTSVRSLSLLQGIFPT